MEGQGLNGKGPGRAFPDRLEPVQRRAIELGAQSVRAQQESARLRALSAELITQLAAIQHRIKRILDRLP